MGWELGNSLLAHSRRKLSKITKKILIISDALKNLPKNECGIDLMIC